MTSSFNTILFGETGIGKSSVVNLIAGRKVAETSREGGGQCTLESKHYTFPVKNRTFHIWDTVGLREPFLSETDYLSLIEKAYTLIQEVAVHGGLDLLLFCIPGNSSITRTMMCNYSLFFEGLCEKRIPIAVVVTHLEGEEEMDKWWGRNEKHLTQCNLKFSGHACVTGTGLPEHPKTAESRHSLDHLLLSHDSDGRHITPSTSRQSFDRLRFLIVPQPKRNQSERLLQDRYMMGSSDPRQLAEVLAQHRHTAMRLPNSITPGEAGKSSVTYPRNPSSPLNVILFGEVGVGKSSVINLLAGEDVSNTSSGSWGCTLEPKRYAFEVAGRTFNVWDTIGLGELSFSASDYLEAIEKTYTLIKQIGARGGLDLLLFCMPCSRITSTMVRNYRLFFEVLCKKQIPIAAVVTRLENERRMEDWWDRNEKYLSQSGLNFGGHACVTGQREHVKAAEGRSALKLLLLSHDHKGRYPMPPASDRFSGFLERFPIIPRAKELKHKRNELERLLRDRCMMDRADAQRLAKIIVDLDRQN